MPRIIDLDRSFNLDEIKDSVEKIFRPGSRVDLLFNYGHSNSYIRSSMIYEFSHRSRTMIISQSSPPLFPRCKGENIHITTVLNKGTNNILRPGLKGKIVDFLSEYKPSEGNTTNAISIKYNLPMDKFDLRKTYRLSPTSESEITGEISYKGGDFYSGEDFYADDISSIGIGLRFPKKIWDKKNPLLNIKVGDRAKIEFSIKDIMPGIRSVKILTEMEIVRKDDYSNKYFGYFGAKYIDINEEDKEMLDKFIIQVQFYQVQEGG